MAIRSRVIRREDTLEDVHAVLAPGLAVIAPREHLAFQPHGRRTPTRLPYESVTHRVPRDAVEHDHPHRMKTRGPVRRTIKRVAAQPGRPSIGGQMVPA